MILGLVGYYGLCSQLTQISPPESHHHFVTFRNHMTLWSNSISACYRILSRVVERLVVSTYLYPALMKPPMVAEITDQFAFRPTGSTTAALIDLLHQLTLMLEKNDYVLLV